MIGKKAFELVVANILFAVSLTCSGNNASVSEPPLRIFAASSLTSVMPAIAQAFDDSEPKLRLEFNFAGTSLLAKQIEHGAQSDVFLSANENWADYLLQRGFLKPDSRRAFLTNELVVLVPEGRHSTITELQDLAKPDIARIAIADWTHVPAGMYAQAALDFAGIWNEIEMKCIPAMDVRAALSYVQRQEVDCAIVYRSDSFLSKDIKIALSIQSAPQNEIHYVGAVCTNSSHPSSSPFLSFLSSERALRIFERHGFARLAHE